MKHHVWIRMLQGLLLGLLAICVGKAAAADTYRGSITSTNATSRNNATTTHSNGAFTLTAGTAYSVLCDNAAYYRATSTSGTAAVNTDYIIAAGTPGAIVRLEAARSHTRIWTLCVSASSCVCHVYEYNP
jgi:hypothetical protein